MSHTTPHHTISLITDDITDQITTTTDHITDHMTSQITGPLGSDHGAFYLSRVERVVGEIRDRGSMLSMCTCKHSPSPAQYSAVQYTTQQQCRATGQSNRELEIFIGTLS